ncbi:sec-independent protein translocase protein TatB [Dyella jiangningensis]|uniref:Sec-independent protein translocase protein TatB n=1 Tax=Dyella sp. AtDHG13 TaxID=1938897 RepID=UPI00088E2147|nr:Sec-independent protein translocase protein TatB [Dyella sp. AtDHG13]PXV53329.1 sec-independent protein translocase protein TatB [Dyella sp. AtDHG13]SDL33873.1 sec-independent protein translocase protein TatB [Dyella jiangningensis]
MIEIDFGKLILLALVALIVLGPEKLPHAARTAGALMRRVRTGWNNVKDEVERELQVEDMRRQAREAAATAQTVRDQWQQTLHGVHSGVDASISPSMPVEEGIATERPLTSTMAQEMSRGST